MMRWVALLRGINVGRSNRLSMAELRATMQSLGFENVTTYIQSGNIVFDAAGTTNADSVSIAAQISAAINDRHQLAVSTALRTATQIDRVARSHPDIDSELDPKLLHVFFLDRVPPPDAVGSLDRSRFEPDVWTAHGSEIYVRYPNGAARSKLTIDVFERAFGATATARNLNTVRKLAALSAAS